jgi:RecA-family ATPase
MIDPIRRGMGFASMNDENEVRKMLAFFERMNDEGITVVATHHNRKANSRGGEMDAMTGSGAFAGDADTVVDHVPRKLGAASDLPQHELRAAQRAARPAAASR